jgi:hypothetical protein
MVCQAYFEEFTEVMMGGYGSGRTSGSRDLTTSYRALDIIAEANRSISLTSDQTAPRGYLAAKKLEP